MATRREHRTHRPSADSVWGGDEPWFASSDETTLVLRDDPLPAAISNLSAADARDRCTTAWQVATRLDNALRIALAFPRLAELGCTIPDAIQDPITDRFPRLAGLQSILAHIAARPCGRRGPESGPLAEPFPQAAFEALMDAIPATVRREAKLLFELGLADFSSGPDNDLADILAGLESHQRGDAPSDADTLVFTDPAHPRLTAFQQELDNLIETLRASPLAAFRVPPTRTNPPPAPPAPTACEPTRRLRTDVDPTAPKIFVDNVGYPVKYETAVWVQVLIDADGDWVTSKQAKARRADLKGQDLHKLKKSLTRPLDGLIESANNCGSKISRSVLYAPVASSTGSV